LRKLAHICAALAVLLLPALAAAQDDGDEGKGFLTRKLQELLSDAGREVRIDGFEGALSSEATIATLTIADDDGVWLSLEGVTLDWNRGALLRGRVEVNRLTAERIALPRLPAGDGDAAAPAPEAQEFALPELPVSVEIGEISAERVNLGAPVLGQATALTAKGGLALVSGRGTATLEIARVDGPRGRFALDASYDNATQDLALDLDLQEEADGIAARLLQLPGRPAVALTVAGTGALSDFTADIRLATEGRDRLTGRVRLARDEDAAGAGTQRFSADLGGDIRPLMDADYRAFFGADTRLDLAGHRTPSGVTVIERLNIETAQFGLGGTARIGADGFPERFDLNGRIAAASGGRVILPAGAPQTSLRSARLTLSYDAKRGSGWQGSILAEEVTRDGTDIDRLALDARGTLTRQPRDTGGIKAVRAQVEATAEGLAFADAALARATGPRVTASAGLSWQAGGALHLADVRLGGADYSLSLDGRVSDLAGGIATRGTVQLSAADLSRFSGLAGRPLRGMAELQAEGSATLLSGSFDIEAAGRTDGLSIGEPTADVLVGGPGRLALSARRDTGGVTLRAFEITTPGLEASAEGSVASGATRLEVAARITDVARLTDALSGPLSVAGTLGQDGADYRLDVALEGPGGSRATVAGSYAPGANRADLDVDGRLPLALADAVLGGGVRLRGDLDFDLAIDGPPGIGALSGRVSTAGTRVLLPEARLTLQDVEARADIAGGAVEIDVGAEVETGGRITADGRVTLAPDAGFPGALRIGLRNVVLEDPALYRTSLAGDVTVDGALAGGARIAGRIDLGETDLRVPTSTFGSLEAIPPITHLGEPGDVRTTRQRAHLLDGDANGDGGTAGPAYPLDVTISAPRRIFLRGRGLDAELGGELRLAGTTAEVIPTGQFELVRGRLDILAQRLVLTEGALSLAGTFEPRVRLVARSETDDGVIVFIIVEGAATDPEITFRSEPELPEDEILAQLFFGRGIDELSAFQAAQLADAIAELSGRGSVGVIGRLRDQFGLDDLDIQTSENGGTTARIGKYITDNVYTDLVIGSDGKTEITINLDVTPSLTARGSVGAEGESGIGIFFERDY